VTESGPGRGPRLEFATAQFFQSLGFFVRRGVKIAVADGLAEVTDIDVLAIRFTLPLAEERLVLDCKERRKSKPFERILWTRGLADFADATRAIIVSPTPPWTAREFAGHGDVEILTNDVVAAHLKKLGRGYLPFGDADSALADSIPIIGHEETRKSFQQKELKLRQMLTHGNPLTNLNRVMQMLSTSELSFDKPDQRDIFFRRFVYNAAAIAAVMFVRFAATSKWTPEKDWMDHAKKLLTYGDLPPKKAQQLAKLVGALPEASGGLPAPDYLDEFLQLLARMIERPEAAAMLPYAIDLELQGKALSRVPTDYFPVTMRGLEGDVTSLCKRTLSAISFATKLPVNVWAPRPAKVAPEAGLRSA